jgi:mono/diheme cytochrome c family protein
MRGDRRTKLCLALLPAPLILGAGVLVSAAAPAGSGKLAPAAADPKNLLAKEAVGILQQNCAVCHAGEKPMGDLRMSKREDLMKGGVSGPAVALEKPEASLLLKAVNYQGRRMPPSGKLPQKQIDTLTQWVKQGLPWPATSGTAPAVAHHGPPPVNAETKRFWSFQPVKRPAVPTPKNRAWVRSPIDAFVLRRLEAEGLAPNPPAPRAALIRRAYYDLTGLPPTPEEVRAFLADKAPNAWEKVVDRLLASPHYGEMWGRHWLDLVRFAETNSYERDGVKPNAWRYRDYVIDAFNKDKPYHQFVMEQLAGDELPGRTPERLIATGYYRLGLWDDEPVDRKQALYDDLDDVVSTTSQVFLGLTVGCARCHDHKIDPIPQKDYYRLLAFFAGVQRYGTRSPESVYEASQRPIVPEAEARRYGAAIQAHRTKLRANQRGIGAVERRVFVDLTPVEKEDWQHEENHPRLVKARVPKLLTEAEFERYQALLDERKRLADSEPPAIASALSVTEEKQPRETHVLMRGNANAEGDIVQPGFPSVLSPPAPVVTSTPYKDSSGRRLALARWITSSSNPLSARVMANRIWQYHFGRGIVRTSSDFGFQGSKPTHPQLLDWLASELVAKGWRLKPFHRMIMLSSTYRMSSRANAKALAKDPENDLLWRFDMRRLQAEEVRDSILAVNGSLNPKMGGPGIYPTIPKEVLAGQSMPGAGWGRGMGQVHPGRAVPAQRLHPREALAHHAHHRQL